MTKTFTIHAWCDRPFIAVLDIDADTPQQAIATARQREDQLLDTAEECNGKYLWDEFAACDEDGNELLRVLDDDARLRNAGPSLRETLLYIALILADFKSDSLRQLGLDAALEQVEKALAIVDHTSAEPSPGTPPADQD